MEESVKKMHEESGEKEILYSKAIKAGKRIYYLDVKRNLKNDLFLAITESKKIQSKDGLQASFEKHKIFLYKEDFDKFTDGIHDVIDYIKRYNGYMPPVEDTGEEDGREEGSDDIKLDIDF
ncbi:MAG: PUR family DNA/RNA-binding protein [Tannerellaceae bacterium]|jgi:hypothetical protein|nr:PUR family DNA/RNA-binding protein [Tannerellaceae bacterium]